MSETTPSAGVQHGRCPSAIKRSYDPRRKIDRKAAISAAVIMSSLAGIAQADAPQSRDPSNAMPIERNAYPFSSIGFVETRYPVAWRTERTVRRSRLTGTAFMISPCYALTAFHVVFGNVPATAKGAVNHAVWVSFGGDGRHFDLDRASAKVVAWGDYADDQTQDWALLAVAGCPGRVPSIGWLEFEPADAPIEDRTAAVGGFSSWSHRFQVSRQADCKLGRRMGRITISHHCFAEPGMSGGPIMISDEHNRPKVAAIVSRRLLIGTPRPIGLQPLQLDLAVVVQAALNDGPFYLRILADREAADGLLARTR